MSGPTKAQLQSDIREYQAEIARLNAELQRLKFTPQVSGHSPRPRKLPAPVGVDVGPRFAGDSQTPKGEEHMHPPEHGRP